MFDLMAAGITPVITHPERLTWVDTHYDLFVRLAERGVWMQVTAGALTGRFGNRVRYWGERFVGDGHCMILATDAHHPTRRPPLLAEAREAAAVLVGREEAGHMVLTRPAGVVANMDPASMPGTLGAGRRTQAQQPKPLQGSVIGNILDRVRRRH